VKVCYNEGLFGIRLTAETQEDEMLIRRIIEDSRRFSDLRREGFLKVIEMVETEGVDPRFSVDLVAHWPHLPK